MDDLRPDAVAARVAAWHNRHPLARRITAAQVQAIGFVALPFVTRPGAARSDALADLPTLPLSDATLGPPPAGSALRARARARAHAPSTLPPGEDPPRGGASAGSQQPHAGVLATLQTWWARQSGRRRAAALVRGKAKLRAKALKPAFSERFLPGLGPSTVARWALRHGRLDVRQTSANALRRVLPDLRLMGDSGATTTLYLATAAVEVGKHRARVLLGDGPAAGAIGSRLYSPTRVAGSFAALALAASVLVGPPLPQVQDLPHTEAWKTTVAWLRRHSGNDPALQTAGPRLAVVDAATPAASAAASAAMDGEAGLPPDTVRMADAPAVAPAGSANDSASAGASGSPPQALADPLAEATELPVRMADAVPQRRDPAAPPLFPDDPPPGVERPEAVPPEPAAAPRKPAAALNPVLRGGLASIKPQMDEESKAAARKAVADLRAARGEAAPAPTPGMLRVAAAPVPPAVKQAAAGAPAYALATRLLRTRAESEQVLVAWRALLARDPRYPLNVSVMPAGDDWRVVSWPFTSQQDAERARSLLAARGLRAETIDF